MKDLNRMNDHAHLPTARDKLLFTPGPLTTSLAVKQAMLHDAGSWHAQFDAMSSFGGMPIDLQACGIDFLISSANKCLEGVPGFALVICRRSMLEACEGCARSLSLDLLGQLRGFDKNGQFRFTPPTHALLAFDQALDELEREGGVVARAARYRRNHTTLLAGMEALGFRSFLRPAVQSWIITAFHYPADPRFSFEGLYLQLSEKGFIIYPGK